jgi:NAD-dependent DNA ligase
METKSKKKGKSGKTRKIRIKKDIEQKPLTKIEMMYIRGQIAEFRRRGISVLDGHNEHTLSDMIRLTNADYYNTQTPLMTDTEYDILKEYVERKYPNNLAIKEVGASTGAKGPSKVALPYEMASMDKIKPDTEALSKWTRRFAGQYVLSCKLDGVSGLYVMDPVSPKLYTRGDGKVGQDISHLLKVLALPKCRSTEPVAIRGEFILPKTVFEEKYKTEFANARNLVSGIINRKTADQKSRDLHFVAYEVVHPPMRPSEQLAYLLDQGFEVARNETVAQLSNTFLSSLLLQWRRDYVYEIDGVIVTDDHIYPRISGNPEHAFAFKMVISDQQAEAKVVDVIWSASKDGYLKPRIRIEPLRLGGVTIEYATGFNGKFIQDNKIGIGAVVQLVRSGDVIPYITEVTVAAETAKMPDVPYIWTDTLVDVILQNPGEDAGVQEKNATAFFAGIGVDGLGKGNIARIFAAGFKTVPAILRMSKADFAKVEGFKEKTVDKLYHNIHDSVGRASILDIIIASGKMGRGLGERKIKLILDAYPDILISQESPKQKEERLKTVNGIGKENSRDFVENIPKCMAFLEECGLGYKILLKGSETSTNVGPEPELSNRVISHSHPLYQKKVVMTKIRDKTIIEALAKYGATLENSMTKDVFVLIVKSKTDTSNKTEYAEKHGIPIMTPDEFIAAFLSK